MNSGLRFATVAVSLSLLLTLATLLAPDPLAHSSALTELICWVESLTQSVPWSQESTRASRSDPYFLEILPLPRTPRTGHLDGIRDDDSPVDPAPIIQALRHQPPTHDARDVQRSQYVAPADTSAQDPPLPSAASGPAPSSSEVDPAPPPAPQANDPSAPQGDDDKVDINVKNQDITSVLEMISHASGRKILASAQVTGPVTVNLPNTGVDEALEKILKIKGFVARQEGDYTLVYTPEELEQVERKQLTFWVYKPVYISADDLKTVLILHLTQQGKITSTKANEVGIGANSDNAGGDSLAAPDAIVVQDTVEKIEELKEIVKELDVQPPQVLIEAVLLSVNLDNEHRMGVNFALLDGQASLTVAGNGGLINASAGFPPSSLVSSGGKVPGGFADNTHGLKYGVINGDLTGFVQLLETVGQTTIVASPKVLALNKQRAEIIVGSRLGYRTRTATETATVENVEFLNLGTQLRLRPFIQPDGRIRMELHPERSSGRINSSTQLPEQETSAVTTNLTVASGMTIVIGGLIEEQQERTVQQVPFLGSIPMVGSLFRDENTSITRQELIVLITPRIVDDEQSYHEAEHDVADFERRRDSLERSFPRQSRMAMARSYYERACAARDSGDLKTALDLVQLSLHFDPTHTPSIRLREQVQRSTGTGQGVRGRRTLWNPTGNRSGARPAATPASQSRS